MGRTRGLPTARGASAPRVPCPALAPLSLGRRALQRSCGRESGRSPPALRELHTPRYITRGKRRPLQWQRPSLRSALPAPGRTPPPTHLPPLHRALPPPAGRLTEPDSPSPTTVAGASRPRRASPCGSRPLPWVAAAGSCQAPRSPEHPPSSSDRPVIALAGLATFASRGSVDSAACDQALRKTAPVEGERRTSAGRPRGGGNRAAWPREAESPRKWPTVTSYLS